MKLVSPPKNVFEPRQAFEVINSFFNYVNKKNPSIMAVYVASLALSAIAKKAIEGRFDINPEEIGICLKGLDGLAEEIVGEYKGFQKKNA